MKDAPEVTERTPIGYRVVTRGLSNTMAGVTRKNVPTQVLAGVTLLAIAIPEQLATSQLAGVPAFIALIAFITATLVFVLFGSNPIVSVGADSTIAPLFAVALVRLAPESSTLYMELVAATALVTGIAVMAIGILRLGWLADFLSLPIVTGFLAGIGLIIIVHQLPHALGIPGGGVSFIQRVETMSHQLGAINGWSVAISIFTLALMVVGERINAMIPWALFGVVISTAVVSIFSLASHGVVLLGTVMVTGPTWRLTWLTSSQWGVVVTTALTLVVVIISQTSATSGTSADEIGVAADLSQDFIAVGLANMATALVGAIPVNASPPRTTISRLAGGRTKLVGLVAGLGALALSPLAAYAHLIPLAALSGVLFFIAGRLIRVSQFRSIWASSRLEFALMTVSCLGVVLIGVEQGLAIAVGLAILDQTWRSAHPRMVELGRRKGTTSWEPYDEHGVERDDHILVIFFDEDLFFANAGVFRRELHELLKKYPRTKHVILDAVAISDIDYTGMVRLGQVVADVIKDHLTISFARANEMVQRRLRESADPALRQIKFFDSTDEAAEKAHHSKG